MGTIKILDACGLIMIITGLTSTVMFIMSKYNLFNKLERFLFSREYFLIIPTRLIRVCYFCIGFWISLFFWLILSADLQMNVFLLSVPFASAGFVWMIIHDKV